MLLEAIIPHVEWKFYKYQTVQMPVLHQPRAQVLKMGTYINPKDLDQEDGLETDPHVTVKYGLMGVTAANLLGLIPKAPFKALVGDLTVFRGTYKDVLVLAVMSPELQKMNQLLRGTFSNVEKHASYFPHITIGYLKRGRADQYLSIPNPLKGQVIELNRLELSNIDSSVTTFRLNSRI